MSNEIAKILQAPSTLQQFAMALPKHLSAERFARIALTEVRKNPDLAKCSPASFLGALVQSAQLGLEPGSGLGHAYLIPFRNNKTGETDCTFMLGYKGLLELARRSGQLKRISAACVYQGDEFDYSLGTSEYIRHKPCGESRAVAVTHAYAVAEFKDGGMQIEIMTRQQIDAIKNRGRQNKVWDSDFSEMARKTVLRRICKFLPLSSEFSDALRGDAESDEVIALPTQNEPAKYRALMIESEAEQAQETAKKEKILALATLERTWVDVQSKGLDPEKITGLEPHAFESESIAFIEAATEKLLGALSK